MTIKQLSVFLENERGSITQVLEILSNNKINILALSLADTEEYGVLRMIVSAPNRARDILRANGIPAHLVDVVALKIYHKSGTLFEAAKRIMDKANIEYMYAFSIDDLAIGIIKVSDPEKLRPLIANNDIVVWTEEEVYGEEL